MGAQKSFLFTLMIGVIIISGAYSKEGADSSDKRAVQKTARTAGRDW